MEEEKEIAKIHIFLEFFTDDSLNKKCYKLLDKILNSINLSIEEVFILDFSYIQFLEKFNRDRLKIDISEILHLNKPELIIIMGDKVPNY